jgi:hypothetical protein
MVSKKLEECVRTAVEKKSRILMTADTAMGIAEEDDFYNFLSLVDSMGVVVEIIPRNPIEDNSVVQVDEA